MSKQRILITTSNDDEQFEVLEELEVLSDNVCFAFEVETALGWTTFIELTKEWLEKYPEDIYTGESKDSGPLFVVAVRKALAALEK